MIHTNPKSGIEFTLIGERPYIRKNGTQTTLKLWQAPCAVCGEPFTISTPISDTANTSSAFYRKHCPDHKIFHSAADFFKAGQAAKRKVSDDEVAKIREMAKDGLDNETIALFYPLTPNSIREIVAGRRRQRQL